MKPFYSIIVPCYNSREMLGDLLQSIVNQHLPKDEIEVILADDCSTEPYDDIVEPFTDKLTIKKVSTDYNYCPANTRQRGAENATGEWMMFADHDDIILPNALSQIKQRIEETDEKYFLATAFYEIEPFTNKIQKKMSPNTGWTHGKVINRANLWDAFNLSYKKDLTSHEDIYIQSEFQCCLQSLGMKPQVAPDIYSYAWRAWPRSQSKSVYTGPDGKEHDFLQVFFRDYIASTGDVYLNRYKDGTIDEEYAKNTCVEIIGYCYFYCQGFKFREPKTYIKKNDWYAKCYVRKVKRTFGITNADILAYFYGNSDCGMWYAIKESSTIATGHIIEPESLIYWLNKIEQIDKDEVKK